ncbi:MAG: NADP-dependent oxidoreductase [Janthinobacterium lividum]
MATMKAARIHQFGGPENLIYEDAPKPEPKDGEVLIKVAAAGINPIDWKVGEGEMEQRVKHPLPLIPGWDVAGTVEALGIGVTAFTIGDAVFAMADNQRDGAYAEYITLPANTVSAKPDSVDFTTAASLALAGTTAWQALNEQAQLKSGQTVLIHGAGGAVGAFAVQFAIFIGAKVIATATGDDVKYVRELGADAVVDYKTEKFEDAAKAVDAVLDTIGGETQARSWAALRDGGVLVTTVGVVNATPEATARGVHGKPFGAHPDASVLAEIARLVDVGQLKPRVAAVKPLAEARQAQELAKGGHTGGKVVLEV